MDFEAPDDMSDIQKRQLADDARNAFFELSQWERDLLITRKPEIAVNLVSSWDWTPEAISTLGEEAMTAYRTDGSQEALARHRLYVDRGLVRPVQPAIRAQRIIGLMQAAKENTAKEIYMTTARRVNDALWELKVSDEVKQQLEGVAQSPFG